MILTHLTHPSITQAFFFIDGKAVQAQILKSVQKCALKVF